MVAREPPSYGYNLAFMHLSHDGAQFINKLGLSDHVLPESGKKVISRTSTPQEIAQYFDIDFEQSDPHQLLMLAIEKGNRNAVDVLVDNVDININQRDAKGRTALTQAVKTGNKEIVECILGIEGIDEDENFRMIAAALIPRADLNERDGNGEHPLKWAICNSIDATKSSNNKRLGFPIINPSVPLLPLILENRELDVERIESDGQSPFILALQCEFFSRLEEFLKRLLASGQFNVNILDGDCRSPLSLAAQKSSSGALKVLLSSPEVDVCSQDKDGRTPLIWSILGDRTDNMYVLLERDDSGVDTPDKDGRTPLSWASERGSLLMVEYLLEKRSDIANKPDHDGRSPLSWAVRRQPTFEHHQRASRTLGGKTDSQNLQIVHCLTNTGGADPASKDNNKRTPLSWAVTTKNLDIVKFLAQHRDVDINDPDEDGRTPLSWSAEQGEIETVKYLLSHDGIDVNLEDKHQRSPLFWATRPGNERMIHQFLEKDRETVHTMMKKGTEVEKVLLLLEAGYDTSKLDTHGQTLLHCAIKAGSLDLRKGYHPPWTKDEFAGFKQTPEDDMLHVKVRLDISGEDGTVNLFVRMMTSFPASFTTLCSASSKQSDMGKVLSCVAMECLRSTHISEPGTRCFFSTLPKTILHGDVIDFILQFLETLEGRWAQLLKAVENYPRLFLTPH
ncbi:hypothetical protein FBEOM_6540 [Fusarium beomiforme]|uniref:Ankyrin n=1 Tax=Fusarium beomiforme TaxID=44412 RepID=A0A9P5AIW4_9HYPO|nr:hypothetical protein FBEOM_6540 [Fusarium beomiforme]